MGDVVIRVPRFGWCLCGKGVVGAPLSTPRSELSCWCRQGEFVVIRVEAPNVVRAAPPDRVYWSVTAKRVGLERSLDGFDAGYFQKKKEST